MKRRVFLGLGMGLVISRPLIAMLNEDRFEAASHWLEEVTSSGNVTAAAIYARIGKSTLHKAFGGAKTVDASFLLGSISKPIAVAALMTLYELAKLQLSDPVHKFIPEFSGNARERVTILHLLTHVSGLPDQLPENADLRKRHAPLSEFVKGTIKVPLRFEPGTQYEYSSMAIMLAMEIARRITGMEFIEFVDKTILQPLGMNHTAFGMGRLNAPNTMASQVEFGAIESGGGSPDSRDWDWNSTYWRNLGAPWGGAQASASDVAKFLEEFMQPKGKLFQPEVVKLIIRNHNPLGMPSRGIGFDVGMSDVVQGASEQTFGHTGSTGTIAWADPARDRVCVVLTTLPAGASAKHVRQLASNSISAIVD